MYHHNSSICSNASGLDRHEDVIDIQCYLRHKQGAGVNDVHKVSQTAEKRRLEGTKFIVHDR